MSLRARPTTELWSCSDCNVTIRPPKPVAFFKGFAFCERCAQGWIDVRGLADRRRLTLVPTGSRAQPSEGAKTRPFRKPRRRKQQQRKAA